MPNNEIVATPESFFTSTLTPIILSETEHIQVSFAGRQVDNRADIKCNIKGKLVIKKKTKKAPLMMKRNSAGKICALVILRRLI